MYPDYKYRPRRRSKGTKKADSRSGVSPSQGFDPSTSYHSLPNNFMYSRHGYGIDDRSGTRDGDNWSIRGLVKKEPGVNGSSAYSDSVSYSPGARSTPESNLSSSPDTMQYDTYSDMAGNTPYFVSSNDASYYGHSNFSVAKIPIPKCVNHQDSSTIAKRSSLPNMSSNTYVQMTNRQQLTTAFPNELLTDINQVHPDELDQYLPKNRPIADYNSNLVKTNQCNTISHWSNYERANPKFTNCDDSQMQNPVSGDVFEFEYDAQPIINALVKTDK